MGVPGFSDYFWLVETPTYPEAKWKYKGNRVFKYPVAKFYPDELQRTAAYDPVREEIIYVNNAYPAGPSTLTYIYDVNSQTWSQNVSSLAPPYTPSNKGFYGKSFLGGPRTAPMCWDGNREVILLLNQVNFSAQTLMYEWDGATRTWTDISALIAPIPYWPPTPYGKGGSHKSVALVWDESRSICWLYFSWLLYGAAPGYKIFQYDNSSRTMTDVTPAGGVEGVDFPEYRKFYGAAYDPINQEFLITHGRGQYSAYTLDDTWTFDGTTWTKRASGAPTGLRSYAPAITGPNGVYLVGGTYYYYGKYLMNIQDHKTFLWGGSSWSEIPSSPNPGQINTQMIAVGHYPY